MNNSIGGGSLACINEINVFDVEKRYRPSKHYVYCIWVFWSDKRKQLIFRRYSQFFELQCKLLDRFKTEAGLTNPNQRILPFLPGKKIFGRSHIKSVALDRLHPINLYCKKLITIKKEIATSDIVLNFFELNNDDIIQSSHHKLNIKQEEPKGGPETISKPFKAEEYICVHNYKALSKTELNIKKNTKVFVIEKNLNGWWFVDSSVEGQGYVPKCVLKPSKEQNSDDDDAPIQSEKNEKFIATRDYKSRKADELDLKKGDYLEIVEKNLNGWWKVKLNDKIGKVPAVYLKKFNASDPVKSAINAWDLFNSSNDYLPPRKDFIDNKSNSSNDSSGDRSSLDFSLNSTQITLNDNQSFQIRTQPNDDDVFYVIQNYEDTAGDCVSLVQGQRVVVLDRENSSGWWYVKIDDTIQGWAPSAFLTKEKPDRPPRPPKPKIKAASASNLCDNNIYVKDASKEFKSISSMKVIGLEPPQKTQMTKSNENNNDSESCNNDILVYKPVKVSELRKKFETNSK